jgi:tripartite-type tricarboxylate transporter receptor subunit TctC
MKSHARPFTRRAALILGALGIAAAAAPAPGQAAESWPSRPIKFVVGYPPGGGADVTARLFADRMAKILHTTIIVENKSGASGTLGAQSVARAAPDGYTLSVAAISEISIAPAIFKALPYDPVKDFAPVVMLAKWSMLLVASPEVPANTLKEFIAYAKKNKGKLNFSSFGTNTINHVAGERFKLAAGIDALHVPFRGSGPSLAALMGNQVQFTFDSPATTLNLVSATKLKAIAVAGRERVPSAPNVPTMAEAGLPDFYVDSWISMLAPPATPKEIIAKLNAAAREAMADPEVKARLAQMNVQPGGGTPEELGSRIREEIAEYRAIAPKVGIEPQ